MAANKGIVELTSTKVLSWIFGVLILGVTISISISVFPDYSLSLTPVGFRTFFELYDAPIKLAAAYGAILGLISLNHRSIQTKDQLDRSSAQIELTQAQHLFTNYYKHREEFVKYTDKIVETLDCKPIGTAALIHSNLFPNAKNGDYTPYEIEHTDFFERLSKIFTKCQSCLDTGKFNQVIRSEFECPLRRAFNDLEILTGTERSANWKFDDTTSPHNFADSVHSMGSIFFLLLRDYWIMARFEKDIQTSETREIMEELENFKNNFKCNHESDVQTQIGPYLKKITTAISKLKA